MKCLIYRVHHYKRNSNLLSKSIKEIFYLHIWQHWTYCPTFQNVTSALLRIRSVHPSESVRFTAFWGEKGESQLDEKGNVFKAGNTLEAEASRGTVRHPRHAAE